MFNVGDIIKKTSNPSVFWKVVYFGTTVFVLARVIQENAVAQEFVVDHAQDSAVPMADVPLWEPVNITIDEA